MSITNTETRFSLLAHGEEKHLTGIRELGFDVHGAFVISVWTTPLGEPRGSYVTCPPISPVEYRRRCPTAASFSRKSGALVIRDDWGARYTIQAPNEILDRLVAECIEHEIPKEG